MGFMALSLTHWTENSLERKDRLFISKVMLVTQDYDFDLQHGRTRDSDHHLFTILTDVFQSRTNWAKVKSVLLRAG